MHNIYDIVGIGLGPFNLSLAALLNPLSNINTKFLDNKPEFSWHPELMFGDAMMQTSFLKDLVTPVDPKSSFSFLSYLVENGQFYHFLNTDRKSINRYEFQDYCKWVSKQLCHDIDFDSKVIDIKHDGEKFEVIKEGGSYFTKNICVASGPTKNIPDCARPFLSNTLFHAKSKQMKTLDLKGKKVVVVGGGQTGVETFRNALNGMWGRVEKVTLLSGRNNLQPLDEAPFTNEIFTPEFVLNFHSLSQEQKDSYTQSQLLASDGNTPQYLQEMYNELYLDRFYLKKLPDYTISPMRWLNEIEKEGESYKLKVDNLLNQNKEIIEADIVILATGFKSVLPSFLEGLSDKIAKDSQGRIIVGQDYSIQTTIENGKIYSMNFSRHGHGVADPQTSLMSWRSAMIANDLVGETKYKTTNNSESFLSFFN
ncbi:SidA/IucD/PvdA family monooxygenase [Halobacteriovorax sp. HFRX-2_2]|uniref:lysine N(6)-hydroxylase/L-ornithine N(5)-oxygenase family protein n=1 Tax=unclassified Halobacteriovorax TaxID=2639665 RepID=UPI0037234228